MSWTRRQAAAALAASALLPLAGGVLGCAAGGRSRRRRVIAAPANFDAVAAEARARVDALRAAVPAPAVDVTRRRLLRSAADATERTLDDDIVEGAVFSATAADGRRIEVATGDTTGPGLQAAAELLAEQARASGFAPAGDAPSGAGIVPATEVALHGGGADARPAVAASAAIELTERLLARARNAGGSRIVFRGALAEVEDARHLHVGPDGERRQRIVRGRAEVTLIATAGARAYVDRAHASAVGSLGRLDIPGRDIDIAADNALALLTSRAVSARSVELLLAPGVAALLAGDVVARRFAGGVDEAAPGPGSVLGSSLVAIADRPRSLDYGVAAFDDRGRTATESVLVDAGVARAGLGFFRRPTPTAAARPCASNLAWQPAGAATGDDLLAGLDGGLAVEGGLDAVYSPASGRVTLRAARGREIRGGKLTGRLFGPIVIRARLVDLLGAVDAVSGASRTFAGRQNGLAVAVSAPFVRTQGEVTGG